MHLFLNGSEKSAHLVAGGSGIAAGPDREVEEFTRRSLPEGCGRVAMQIAKHGGNIANQDHLPVYWKGSHVC